MGLIILASFCACEDPQYFVHLSVEDPNELASDATRLGFGKTLDDLRVVGLGNETFPTSIALSYKTKIEHLIWVEASNESGEILARGLALIEVRKKKTAQASVDLLFACEQANSTGQSCALESASTLKGSCIENTCKTLSCGDGYISDGEECDDGNTKDNDGCSAQCITEEAICGNAIVEEDEICDDGYSDACGSCNVDCSAVGIGASCGDGIHCAEVEECDDGNTDTEKCDYGQETCTVCDALCRSIPGATANCGDGFFTSTHEECDPLHADYSAITCTEECKHKEWLHAAHSETLEIETVKTIVSKDGGFIVGAQLTGTGSMEFDDIHGNTHTITGDGKAEGLIIAYDADANIKWIQTLDGSSHVLLKGLAQSDEGEIYAVGQYFENINIAAAFNFPEVEEKAGFFFTYSNQGELETAKAFQSSEAVALQNVAAHLDKIILVGSYRNTLDLNFLATPVSSEAVLADPGANTDLFIAAYQSDYTFLWKKTFACDKAEVEPYGLVVDTDANIYAALNYPLSCALSATSLLPNLEMADAALVKLNSNGEVQSHISFNGDYDQYFNALKVNIQGALYVSGYFYNKFILNVTTEFDTPGGDEHARQQCFLGAFHTTDLKEEWFKNISGCKSPSSSAPHRSFITTDKSNEEIIFASEFSGTMTVEEQSFDVEGSGEDVFWLKLKSDGTLEQTFILGGDGKDKIYSMTYLTNDTYLLTGTFANTITYSKDDTLHADVGEENGFYMIRMNPGELSPALP
ncbi:MAG: myxococcus cysteine-rich repeat containing protein [Myxococcota bacterium]|nr:myxococcus cysteine-rich repeat containing protein [Myxococcota bacterium]